MKKSILIVALVCIHACIFAQLSVDQLLCEQMSQPIGIDTKKPRLTWKLKTSLPSTMQSAYEVVVKKGKQKVWSTGKVMSDQSVFLEYNG